MKDRELVRDLAGLKWEESSGKPPTFGTQLGPELVEEINKRRLFAGESDNAILRRLVDARREHAGAKPRPGNMADWVIREFLHPRWRTTGMGALPGAVAKARKFVLDDNMSAMLADLSFAPLEARDPVAALEALRQSARLPYEHVWIEYSNTAKLRRANEAYGQNFILEDGNLPRKLGWLCWQHKTIETAFCAVECASDGFSKTTGGEPEAIVARPQTNVFAYMWRTDDGPLPWAHYQYPRAHMAPCAAIVGRADYTSAQVGITASPFYIPAFRERFVEFNDYNMLEQVQGDLRHLWAFLATLGDVPVVQTDVRPSKGHIVRGRYKAFVEHKVLSLQIPTRVARRLAQRLVGQLAKRRAHEVRGFWRLHARGDAQCVHVWLAQEDDAKHLRCACGSFKTWVRAHQRGDASLGIVTHDYEVKGQVEGRA